MAENASANFGGEAFLPLHYFRVLRARQLEAWLVCHARVEPEVRALFPDDGDRLFFVPDLPAHRVLDRLTHMPFLPIKVGQVIFGTLSTLLTQVLQRRMVRRLVAELRVDVVHEPIPVSPKQPSAMYDVGAPVVIGPMNGGMDFPPGLRYLQRSWERRSLHLARWLASSLNRAIPGKRKAAALVVANERTRAALPASVAAVPVFELVENGVDMSRFAPGRARKAATEGKVRYAFVGRLVDWKAVDILLDALAVARANAEIELDVFGDGPERAALEAQVRALGLQGAVRFHGFVPQEQVASELPEFDALVLPSLYECGGAVVLEAMATAVPVIATRWGGPADYLDDECGVLLDPVDRPTLVASLARVMQELARDPARREALGRAGRRKVVAHYDWERKVDSMLGIYSMVASVAGARAGDAAATAGETGDRPSSTPPAPQVPVPRG